MSDAPDGEDSSDEVDIPDAEDAPAITKHKGPWDEVVNRAILLAPWVGAIVFLGWLMYTGSLATDLRVQGTVSAAPLVYGAGALVGLTYLLALMKFYGASPVVWVANAAANYNPEEEDGTAE